jgi:acyl-CoA synthetase (AMP-forming)/AMP-acid ligase II
VVDDPPAVPGAGWSALSALTVAAAAVVAHPDRTQVAAGHDLWQMYTSGTTGRPKGAVLTHAAVRANAEQFRTALSIGEADRVLVAMPLFHVAATILMALPIAAGATLRLVEGFDPSACARIIDDENITCAPLAPTMIQALLAGGAGLEGRRFASLRTVVYGASPIAESTLRQAMSVFDCDFVQGYGQTEAGGALTVLGADAHHRALAGEPHLLRSCGRAMDGTEIAVIDGDGRPLPTGEVGEIVARGPQLMRAYWNRPEATAEALRGGWLHTGDAGRLDDEGFLYLADRIKDMIISGGENVYPREVEDVIAALPEVADVAVIGVPDDRWGEAVKAVIVPAPAATLTAEALIAWCRSQLAGYKAPRSVDFVDALPRNASGKVLKTVLREPYWAGHNRRVG